MGSRRFATVVSGLFFGAFLAGCGVHTNSGSNQSTLSITTSATVVTGVVGVSYSITLVATGGTPPYTWSVSSGTLPPGLSLSSVGVLSGTPTTVGSSSFTIQVKDSATAAQTATLTVTLAIAPVLGITTTSPLTTGVAGVVYSNALAAAGGTPPYAWSISSGAAPAGLSLSGAGVLSGTPTKAGSSSFTVQVKDSATPSQSATLPVMLTVNAALSVTTAMLPPGLANAAYTTTLAATGGIPPYTWSLDTSAPPLPSPLTLNTVGTISGTPTTASNSNSGFVVTDSANNTAEAKLNLTINGDPDGTYAFLFSGTSPQGTPAVQSGVAIVGEFTVQNGAVISGYYDENTDTSLTEAPPVLEQPITGGTLTPGTDGLTTLALNVMNGNVSGTMTFALATPPSAAPGNNSSIRIIGFSDTTGTGVRGSGVLRPSTPGAISTAPSSFAFLIAGADGNQSEQALIASFQTDGNGNLLNGKADANQLGGQFAHWSTLSGSYSIDANGRGLLELGLGPNPGYDYSYAFYEVSPSEWLMMSIDPVTNNGPLAAGTVLQQTGSGSFGVASIPATAVLEASGIKPFTSGTTPDITLGLATSDGSGNVTYSYDEYAGTLSSGQSLGPINYAVDATTGRAASTGATDEPILYLVDSSSTKAAFVLFPGASASSGILEAQSGSGFANASFTGNYLGGSLPLNSPAVLNEDGLVSADGNGNLLLSTDRSSSQGLVSYQNVSGTYAVAGNGRVVATTPDGDTRIFYIVGPNKVAYLTGDGGGYLGSFQQ